MLAINARNALPHYAIANRAVLADPVREGQDPLRGIGVERHCAVNQTVFQEGDPNEHMFKVSRGVLKIYKTLGDGRRQVTGFLYPGDLLGLGAGVSYAYTAEAVTETVLVSYRRSTLEESINRSPAIARWLFSVASTELTAAQDQMLLLGRKTAVERVTSFLLNLSERAVQRGEDSDHIHVPMTRYDIADYLGVTTETVSRTITRLKTLGIVRLCPNNCIDLVDSNRLIELSENEGGLGRAG